MGLATSFHIGKSYSEDVGGKGVHVWGMSQILHHTKGSFLTAPICPMLEKFSMWSLFIMLQPTREIESPCILSSHEWKMKGFQRFADLIIWFQSVLLVFQILMSHHSRQEKICWSNQVWYGRHDAWSDFYYSINRSWEGGGGGGGGSFKICHANEHLSEQLL